MPNIHTEKDIVEWIRNDKWMMDILITVHTLQLPDWWICAGFVRSKVWDVLHGIETRSPLPDIDVVFFDSAHVQLDYELKFESTLKSLNPEIPWSVKNQARMHLRNDDTPYMSSTDAISRFPETATAVGVRLDSQGNVILTAPYGIEDLIHLVVRPTQHFINNAIIKGALYNDRINKKRWEQHWNKLQIVYLL